MLGTVDWDTPDAGNEHVVMRAAAGARAGVLRNRLVHVRDDDAGLDFLARVSDGPFFPHSKDGTNEVTARLEIQGELDAGRLCDTSSRPGPGASVVALADDEVAGLIGSRGDMLLGHLAGHGRVPLCLDSKSKAVLPRNLGIFGTVGSGKSNTCQVVIEEASRAGWAVVVIDVEGEYTAMDEPAESGGSAARPPAGIKDFAVYQPASCPGERKDALGLTLRLGDFHASVIAELLGATPPERNALYECIDHYMTRNRTQIAVNEREEMQGLVDASPGVKLPFTLFQLRERCTERSSKGTADLDYVGLGGKLGRLMHAKTFDEPGKPALDVSKLMSAGRVSILDVSAASEVVQNLITADVLRKSFAYKMLHDEAPPALVVIEEAHSFISKDRLESLHATLGMLRMVARRGRKRWLSLAFVSQQPGHLPQEVFELTNTRIVHNLRSQNNLDALRATAGDVAQGLWDHCPLLGAGEALVSSPQMRRAAVARIRPASSRRRFTR